MSNKKEFRCASCNKLLARTSGETEIKCPRCGVMNVINTTAGTIRFIENVKGRVTASGVQFR